MLVLPCISDNSSHFQVLGKFFHYTFLKLATLEFKERLTGGKF